MGLLEDKTAVIYGGGGDIGSAVARAFLREGADVHVVGRTQERLDAVEGAKTAIVDALDEAQVEAHADSVGRIDVSLNVITHPYTHGTPFADLTVDEFMAPPEVALRSNFITSRAAVRRMIEHKAGVILFFGGTGAPIKGYHLGATQVAFDGMESLRRLISVEAGPYGVRAVSLVSGGIFGDEMPQEVIDGALELAMLPRTGTHEDVGNAAVFAASDMGAALTAATVNICAARSSTSRRVRGRRMAPSTPRRHQASRGTSPRHAPVSAPRDSISFLKRSRSAATRRSSAPSAAPTFSLTPSGAQSIWSITRVGRRRSCGTSRRPRCPCRPCCARRRALRDSAR